MEIKEIERIRKEIELIEAKGFSVSNEELKKLVNLRTELSYLEWFNK